MFSRSKSEGGSPETSGRLRLILIFAGAAVGILLILLGGGDLFSSEEIADEPDAPTAQQELAQYQDYIEERVRSLCESVEGVSGVTVAVTLSGNFEEIYATEQVDGNEEYVIVGSGSNASALYVSRRAPQLIGIGVVCRGGGNADIRQELTALLCAAFQISSNRVYIAEAKS